ncbi:MAG: hypothetical protein V1752_08790 [Candidatus Firestonebacteria bacterium]
MPVLTRKADDSEVQYLFGKSLPYRSRQIIIIIFIVGGILLQLFYSFFLGFIMVIIGSALSLIKGYRPVPVIKSNEEKWSQVTPNEYAKVKVTADAALKWDEDSFDVTSKRGVWLFLLVILFSAGLFFIAPVFLPGEIVFMILANIAVLLVPQWVTGTREYLKLDKLIIKINILQKIIGLLNSPSDVQVLPMLATKKTEKGKKVPSDARLMLKLLNAPDWFMGAQVQISINNVQGVDYPYVYCVLIFKGEAKVFQKKSNVFDRFSDSGAVSYKETPIPTSNFIERAADRLYSKTAITVEKTNSEDVDVLVIRQRTSKTEGYFTTPSNVRDLVLYTLEAAKTITTSKP